jgi:hypothetical protein
MRKKRWWLAVGAAALGVALAGVVLGLVFTGGGGGGEPKPLSHDDYTRIWHETRVGESRDEVLARWPKDTYQHYRDNLKDECFQWRDDRLYLYNLCFTAGVLRSMDLE